MAGHIWWASDDTNRLTRSPCYLVLFWVFLIIHMLCISQIGPPVELVRAHLSMCQIRFRSFVLVVNRLRANPTAGLYQKNCEGRVFSPQPPLAQATQRVCEARATWKWISIHPQPFKRLRKRSKVRSAPIDPTKRSTVFRQVVRSSALLRPLICTIRLYVVKLAKWNFSHEIVWIV